MAKTMTHKEAMRLMVNRLLESDVRDNARKSGEFLTPTDIHMNVEIIDKYKDAEFLYRPDVMLISGLEEDAELDDNEATLLLDAYVAVWSFIQGGDGIESMDVELFFNNDFETTNYLPIKAIEDVLNRNGYELVYDCDRECFDLVRTGTNEVIDTYYY